MRWVGLGADRGGAGRGPRGGGDGVRPEREWERLCGGGAARWKGAARRRLHVAPAAARSRADGEPADRTVESGRFAGRGFRDGAQWRRDGDRAAGGWPDPRGGSIHGSEDAWKRARGGAQRPGPTRAQWGDRSELRSESDGCAVVSGASLRARGAARRA